MIPFHLLSSGRMALPVVVVEDLWKTAAPQRELLSTPYVGASTTNSRGFCLLLSIWVSSSPMSCLFFLVCTRACVLPSSCLSFPFSYFPLVLSDPILSTSPLSLTFKNMCPISLYQSSVVSVCVRVCVLNLLQFSALAAGPNV